MMSPHDATQSCSAIRAALTSACAGHSVIYGPDMARETTPAVERLHARGAHFFWVAMPVGTVEYLELHVGIVLDVEAGTARAGLHRGAASEIGTRLFAALEGERSAHGLELVHSDAAEEIQFVHAPHDLRAAASTAMLCREAHALLGWAETALKELK